MQNENNYIALVILSGILAMAFAFWKASWINKQNEGNECMKIIGRIISYEDLTWVTTFPPIFV